MATFGIENLKKAATLGASFGKQIETAGADGWKMTDFFGFIDEFAGLPEVLNNKQAIVNEFKDLDAAERAALLEHVKNELDLKDDALEEKIEKGLGLVVAILEVVEVFKKKPAEPTV